MQAVNPNGTKPTPPSRQQSLGIQLGDVGYKDHTVDENKSVAPSHLTLQITIFLKEDL